MLKRFLAALFFALFLVPFCAGTDLAEPLVRGNFWKMSESEFRRLFNGMRYSTVDENTIRVRKDKSLTFGTLNLGEILVTREAGAYAKLDVVIYSKGDDGALGRDDFEKLLEKSVAAIDAATGTAGTPSRTGARETGVKTRMWKWNLPACFVRLEAATSGTGRGGAFTAEFIRVSFGPSEESLERGGAADIVSRRDLKENVKRDADGNVRIEGIPMVDQGNKGYCVPATVSRVFAYYGMDGVDQHALAALCKTAAGGGTSSRAMAEALEQICRVFRMRVLALDGNNLNNYVAEYNKAAKKLKRPLITESNLSKATIGADVVLEAFAGKPVQQRKWLAAVRKNIDAGVPVVWSVRLGLFPEPGRSRQTGGGHMRLIVGYNEAEGIVFFSDSWGASHACKKMPLRQACAITVSRYVLRPNR